MTATATDPALIACLILFLAIATYWNLFHPWNY